MLGDGTIGSPSGARLDVIQRSERLGIEWRDFSIGRGEHVSFDQPSRSAVALNRVTGPQISNIEGTLTANGNVFLVNRNGVIFHKSAMVDVGGLLATTIDIANEDFLAGRYRFNRNDNPDGRVVNEGSISAAEGGLVALVAPSVRNAGVIEARLGRVALGSGNTFTLDLFGDELVSFAVDERVAQRLMGLDGEPIDVQVDQSGTIDAPGGRVWLTANAARGIVDSVINLSGLVKAQSVRNRDGRIVLEGGDAGRVQVAGDIDAMGGPAESGGRIEVLGESIELAATARLDASGGAGGGTVLVGGDYRGRGTRQRSARTTVEAGSAIRADATHAGDGGTVVVWSDERTVVDGLLSARGGPQGGNGGLIETSSAGELVFSVPVQVDAPGGRAGTWLLDPEDIDIDRSKADAIETTLNEGGNVSIKTADGGDGDGNIYVNASITKTEGDDASLSMTAHNRIDVNQPIRSEAGKLDVSLKAGRQIDVKAGIETNGGNFSSSVTGIPEPDPAADTDDSGVEVADAEIPDTSEETETTGNADEVESESDSNETNSNNDPDGAAFMADSNQETPSEPAEDEPVAQVSVNDETETDTIDNDATADPVSGSIDAAEHVAATGSAPADAAGSDIPFIAVEESVATRGGDISVDAGETGAAVVTGTLDASNMNPGETGGDIEVLGQHVLLVGEAEVDASGDAGGGDIHIGGDYQGRGERHNAQTTTVGEHVTIRSDATGDGDAGTVVVWSDGTTRFSGHVSARGGPDGGDGGAVEVSGKQNLGFWGTVETEAPKGAAGSLLLDPETITIIDAVRGQGDHDLNVLCTSDTRNCWFPPELLLIEPSWTEDLLEFYGYEPNPETPLNTLTWDRLIQLADATGFGLRLAAEEDVTIAAFTGAVSTPGSPAGDNDQLTITLPLNDRGSPAFALRVTSNHGDIFFENPDNNLAVLGGFMIFEAPEGELRLGNLYGLGRPVSIGAETPTGWSWGSVSLSAGGDIETGTINTRTVPARFADPVTGAPLPQPLMIGDTSTFDPSALLNPPAFTAFPDASDFDPQVIIDSTSSLSDFARGGPVGITSTGGNINILGPIYTASGDFSADAAGTFTATNIDTGTNRILVKSSDADPGTLQTLNTGIVGITADGITFNQINAGQVELEALTYSPDAITGAVVIDTFRNADFIGGRPESEGISFVDASEPGLTLNVGPDARCAGDCIQDLIFDLAELGQATTFLGLDAGDELGAANTQLGLGGTVQLNLGPGFTFLGGDVSNDARHVPLAMEFGGLFLNLPPGPVPIEVPLGLPSQPRVPAPGDGIVPAAPLPASPLPDGPVVADRPPGITFVETESAVASSADVQRIKDEGKETQAKEETDPCTGDDRLEWLKRGPRSAVRGLDWGRRSAIGTDPEDTEDVFKPNNCYFSSARIATDAVPVR